MTISDNKKKREEELRKLKYSDILTVLKESDEALQGKYETFSKLIHEEKKWAKAFAKQELSWYSDFIEQYYRLREQALNSGQPHLYFKLDHIDQFCSSKNIDYDLLIFLAKKNIGKTSEIYRQIKKTIDKGEKFIYLRLSKDELIKAADAFNNDSLSPVYCYKDKATYKFYSKKQIREILTIEGKGEENKISFTVRWLKDRGIEEVGCGYEFQFCQSYTGGAYEKYTKIFYDECLSYNPRKVLNDSHLSNWAAFLSSIARNKDDLKVYLFGNLLATNSIILDFYGIKRDDALRYIVRGGDVEKGCRILFINAGSLYTGYEAQTRTARHAGGKYELRLSSNEYLPKNINLIEPSLFDQMDIVKCIYARNKLIYEIRKLEYTEGLKTNKIYAIRSWPEKFGEEIFLENEIYTDNRGWLNSYYGLKYVPSIERWEALIVTKHHFNKLRYYDDDTITQVEKLYESQKAKILGIKDN